MRIIQKAGLILFLLGFTIFLASFFLPRYMLTYDIISENISDKTKVEAFEAVANPLVNRTFNSNFTFVSKLKAAFSEVNSRQVKKYGLSAEEINKITAENKEKFQLGTLDKIFDSSTENGAYKLQKFRDYGSWLDGRTFSNEAELKKQITTIANNIAKYSIIGEKGFDKYQIKNLKYSLTKDSSIGPVDDNPTLFIILTYVFCIAGAAMFLIPKVKLEGPPGIKNNGIFFSVMKNRGWLGIATGTFLILFYIILYFYPEYMTSWIIMVDPVSYALKNAEAGRFFLYGFIYTLCILVMGVRMIIHYRHSKYQVTRTFSVMFFQTALAFLVPEILLRLNQPYFDFKNIWPLDYDFFFASSLNELIQNGTLGIFMLGWGIGLIIIGVPVFVYFFGKRWYCSWVCGCGGLAETLGDPYRQLSDKSLPAWQIERVIIHSVLVFAVLMTAMVLYTYFTGSSLAFSASRWLLIGLVILLGAGFYRYHNKLFPKIPSKKVLNNVLAFGGLIIVSLLYGFFTEGSTMVEFKSTTVKEWYGFYIGAGFAGVVGTGFYPFMGNRVWCRFGCPLAAYLGLVQRFKSRFRITTNGGQCISCGNCSTYCEMGIDVRWYAQRGQNIIRSSCVGCGICSAVCPRGVLNLENKDEKGRFGKPITIGNKVTVEN